MPVESQLSRTKLQGKREVVGGWRWGVTENHFSKAEPPEPSECKSWLPGSGVQAEPGQRAPASVHAHKGREDSGRSLAEAHRAGQARDRGRMANSNATTEGLSAQQGRKPRGFLEMSPVNNNNQPQ